MTLNNKLSLSKEIFIAEKNNNFLFLNPKCPDWLVVNSNSAFILNLCNGKNNIDDISKLLKSQNANIRINEIRNLLKSAFSHSIITEVGQQVQDDQRDPHPYKLRIVHLKLTDDCNLRCKYCYAQSGGKSKILTSDTLENISKEVASISDNVEYVLSGGEPLLNPECLNFAVKIKNMGHQAHLLSNGVLINNTNAKQISKTFDLIKISLDGASEEIHSLTRGSNNFNKVTNAIELLNKNNANVLVAMTVTRENTEDIPKLVKRYGSQLTFQPFFNAGRGKHNNNLALTGSEYYDALASVSGVSPMSAIDKVLSRARNQGIFKCAIGDAEISISENGDVYPCQMLDDPLFLAGNIQQSSLTHIYHNSEVLKKVRKLNINNIEECKTCPIRLICGGACRARSFHANGKIDIAGDFCEYERLAYINGIFNSSSLENSKKDS